MSKIHYCEFCGTIGASKTPVYGTFYSGMFYLCEHCSENVGNFSIDGNTRSEFLEEVCGIPELYMHGPKSSAFTRDRNDWELINKCDNCSRKMSEGVSFGDTVKITPNIKKALPSKLRNAKNSHLCPLCISALQIKMVSRIPEGKLPLHINDKEFMGVDGHEWDYLNDDYKSLVSKRLQGLPLEEINSLLAPKVKKCLDISVEYLTEEDRVLFGQDGELITNEDDEGNTDPNPLIIAEYEHGYLIELDIDPYIAASDLHESLKNFGYSQKFRNIIFMTMELKFDYIRFDTIGPRYQEFETSKK